MGNIGDNNSINTLLARHSLYRGIYSRVAKELGLDRSFVSRVANGQRHSPRVQAALVKEIKRIERLTKSS